MKKKNFAFKYGLSNGSSKQLVAHLLSIEKVLKKVKDVWQEMTNTVFTKEVIRDFIDEKVEEINESQKLNYMRWDVLNKKQFMEAVLRGSFEAEVDYLKEFVEDRFDVFGNIVDTATVESVLEEVKGRNPWGGGGGWGNGDRPWGRGNNTWPRGNNSWPNGDNPWGGNGNNPWGGNGENPLNTGNNP